MVPPSPPRVSPSDKGKLERRLQAAAAELQVPEAAYVFKWVRKPNKQKSTAWKGFEREVADVAARFGFTSRRISRGADLGESDVDVVLEEAPGLRIDCKYRAKQAHHSLFLEVESKYVSEPGQRLWLPTKVAGEAGSLVVMRTEEAFSLLRDAMGRDAGNHLVCSCCRTPLLKPMWIPAPTGLSTATCPSCGLVLQVPSARVPEPPPEDGIEHQRDDQDQS